MAESAALDKLYQASTTLVGVNAKLAKEGVDEFAEVRGRGAPRARLRPPWPPLCLQRRARARGDLDALGARRAPWRALCGADVAGQGGAGASAGLGLRPRSSAWLLARRAGGSTRTGRAPRAEQNCNVGGQADAPGGRCCAACKQRGGCARGAACEQRGVVPCV